MRRLIDILVTAIAPLTWGTTYLLTTHALPTGRPLLDAVARSLPVGLLILAFTRQLPRGSWWWRSAVLVAVVARRPRENRGERHRQEDHEGQENCVAGSHFGS